MSPFISLNSWNQPGAILQAAEPEEIVEGGPDDWEKLRDLLARRRKTGRDSVHPQSAAVGYITYEGAFRFAWFPKISLLAGNGFSALWNERRTGWVARTTPLSRVRARHFARQEATHGARTKSRAEFEARVARAQEYIAAGDIYQVNLAQKFTTPFTGNPYRLFEHLLARSPAPGGAFLDFGDTRILSASPELFLRIRGRHVTTRPIKGTRPRSRDPVRDEQLAFELLTDPKELAELVMITDLERNDLGQICEYGSVTVTQLVQLERFAQVFHLVSTIEGMLRPGIDALDAVRACIPGGSISGAPKKRALRNHPRTRAVPARHLHRPHRLLRRQRRRRLQHRHPHHGPGGRQSPLLRRQRHHRRLSSRPRIRRDAAQGGGHGAGDGRLFRRRSV